MRNKMMKEYGREGFILTKIEEVLNSNTSSSCIIMKEGFEDIVDCDEFDNILQNIQKSNKHISIKDTSESIMLIDRYTNDKIIIDLESYEQACENVVYIANKIADKINELSKTVLENKRCVNPIAFLIDSEKWNLPFGYSNAALKLASHTLPMMLSIKLGEGLIKSNDKLAIYNDVKGISTTALVYMPFNYVMESMSELVNPFQTVKKYVVNI